MNFDYLLALLASKNGWLSDTPTSQPLNDRNSSFSMNSGSECRWGHPLLIEHTGEYWPRCFTRSITKRLMTFHNIFIDWINDFSLVVQDGSCWKRKLVLKCRRSVRTSSPLSLDGFLKADEQSKYGRICLFFSIATAISRNETSRG